MLKAGPCGPAVSALDVERLLFGRFAVGTARRRRDLPVLKRERSLAVGLPEAYM